MSKRTQYAATALLIFITFVWGFTFVTNQYVLKTMSSPDLLAWRFCIAALVLLAFKPRAILQLTSIERKHGLILGVFLTLGYLAQNAGLTKTTATASGFITGMFVVLTPIVGGLIFRQRISIAAWLAVALATIGLALIAIQGTSVNTGDLFSFLCAISFAFQIVLLSRWSKAEIVYGLATLQLLVTGISSLIISLISGGPALPSDSKIWWSIALLSVIGSSLGFFAQTWVQSQVSATRAAIILTMEPVFAGIAGVTIGSDQLTARLVAGAACVLIAMYLVELGPDKHELVVAIER
ncbi:MAG: DMT family transporter [Actinomycetales bacterium]|nr:DMT family transporter [Actinomycetales bacterium]